MLQFMRNQASSWVVKFLMILLVISFGIWGIGDMFRSRAEGNNVVTVGDSSLSAGQLRAMVDQQFQQFRERYKNAEIADNPALRTALAQNSLQQWVSEKLYLQEATHLGLAVSDDILRRRIAENPLFADEKTHKFSPIKFRSILQANNLTESQYLTLVRHEIVNSQLAYALAGSLYPPKILQQATFDYNNELRDAAVLEIPYGKYPAFAKLLGKDKIGSPSEDDLTRYLEDHKDQFSTAEYRKLTILTLSPADVAKNEKISDAELQQAFEAHKAEYDVPEKRDIQQAVLKTEAEAKAVYDAVSSGKESFEAAAKKQKAAPVDLNKIAQGDLPQAELAKAAFALKTGEYSKPVQSTLGWHVLHAKKIYPAQHKTLAEVRGDLEKKLAAEKSSDRIYKLSDTLQDEIAGGGKLEDAAKKVSGHIEKTVYIDRNGKDQTGKNAALPLGKSQDTLLKVAFSTDPGRNSGLTEATEGGFFVVRVDETIPSRLRSLKEARGEVLSAWQKTDQEKTGALIGAKLAEEIRNGKKIDELSRTYGIAPRQLSKFGREGESANSAYARGLSAVGKGQAATLPFKDGIAVGVVTASYPTTKKMDGEIGIQALLKREMSQDIAQQFQDALRERFDVEVNQKALSTLY